MNRSGKAIVKAKAGNVTRSGKDYRSVLFGMVQLLDAARRASARTVNAIMTATYWELGRRIVEFEQGGKGRAHYGEELLKRLSADLTARFGRGFSRTNLQKYRQFYLGWTVPEMCPTASGKSEVEKCPTASGKSGSEIPSVSLAESGGRYLSTPSTESLPLLDKSATSLRKSQILPPVSHLRALAGRFPLPWSHYVRLLSVTNSLAREFYETEALRGGWTVRQLDRQIGTQFYERTALSRNKAAMLVKGQKPRPQDAVSADEEIRDPLLLEFLNLKDEYSEHQLEEALVRHLEGFLLELGGDFTFVGRQRRLRIDDTWYRVDLLFFHRLLRCLVIFDLKLGKLTPTDIGQMHLYCNYARAHWTRPGENPPVGVILCASQGESLAHYALEGLPNKMVVREYRTALPSEKLLAAEIQKARKLLEARTTGGRRR